MRGPSRAHTNSHCAIVLLAIVFSIASVSVVAEAEKAGAEGIDGLAGLIATANENPDRLHETLHGARILAELGAGYEAARVFAGIAHYAPNTDPGRQAKEMLDDDSSHCGLKSRQASSASWREHQHEDEGFPSFWHRDRDW